MKTFKKILGILLAVTMIFTLVAVPTSAAISVAKGEYTVQEWDFDSEYSASYEAADKVTFLDDGEIAIANKNWHDDTAAPTARTIKNGVLKIELKTSSNSKYFSTTNIALRLDTTLKAGKEYTFKLGMYSPDKVWSYKTYIMYSNSTLNTTTFAPYIANKSGTPSVDSEANFGIPEYATKLNVTQIGSLTDTYKTHSFKFTPATDITAGNYIRVALNFRNTAADTVKTVYVDEMMIKAGAADVDVPATEQMTDAKGNLKVQSWQLNSAYSNEALQAGSADVVTFLDENEIAVAYKNWHDNTAAPTKRTIENGVLKLELSKNSATKYFSTTNIALRLDQTLIAGQAYKFQLGMYSPDKIWSYKTYIMTSNSTLNTTTFTPYLANKSGTPSVDSEANFGIPEYATKLNVRQIGSLTDTNKVHEFTFVPATDISAGDYLRVALNFQNNADAVKTVYVTSFDLLAVNPNLEQKDEKGRFEVQDWKFDSNYTASYLAADKVTFMDEDEIAIANKNWHDDTAAPTARTIKDGVMKIELKTSSNSSYFSTTNVALRLDHTLKAGTEYTFQLGMYSPDKIWSYKTYIMYSNAASLTNSGFAAYIANKTGPNVDTEANFGIGTDTTKLNVTQIGSLTDTNKVYDFTFTPEEDVVAGNYIRVALNFKNTDADKIKTVYVTSLGLKASADKFLDEYYFTDEGSRERVWENAEEIDGGAYKRSGQNMIVVLKDEYLQADTEYTAMLNAAVTYEGAYLDVYAFGEKPKDYVGKDEYDSYYNNLENAKLIKQNVAWINNITNNDLSTRFAIKAVFTTSDTDIDYSEYKYLALVVKNKKNADGSVNWNNQIFLDDLVLFKTIKGKAPEGMRETVVIKNYAKKLKVESDRFAKYFLKNSDGTYTQLSSTEDAITDLTPDTEYTVVTKWIDDGRYYASEGYGEEFTFKTIKFGDMNRDDEVDIIDLVVQKKASVAESVEDPDNFDMDGDGKFVALDIAQLRKVLLSIVD